MYKLINNQYSRIKVPQLSCLCFIFATFCSNLYDCDDRDRDYGRDDHGHGDYGHGHVHVHDDYGYGCGYAKPFWYVYLSFLITNWSIALLS